MITLLLPAALPPGVCEQNLSKSYERILMKFFGEVGRGPGTNRLDFGGDPLTPSFISPIFHPISVCW